MIVMEDVFCFRAKRNGRNCILYIAYMNSFMTIDDFIDMGLRSSDEKKYYIENLCVAFSLLQ